MSNEFVDPRTQLRELIVAITEIGSGKVLPPATNLVDYSKISKSDLYNVAVGEAQPIKELLNTQLELVGYVVKVSDEETNENGEIGRYPISKLLCADGKVVLSGSRGITECLAMITACEGMGPWSPPISVIPRARSVGGTKQWFWLELVESPPAEQRKRR